MNLVPQFLHKYIRSYWIPALVLLYLIGHVYILTYKRPWFYPYSCLPIALFIIYTAIFHLQQLVLLLAFCTPLSITLKEMGLTEGPDLSIPTEPIMAGIMLLFILNHFQKPLITRDFRYHPVTVLIIIQLSWMLITTLTSTGIIISVKYLIARLWFIFSCYLIIPHLFSDKKNIVRFVFAYAVALMIVVAYTTIIHARFAFNEKAADWVVSPFYNDHTAYGAALAMFVPILVAFMFTSLVPKPLKLLAFCLFVAFIGATILSFARAAWLSLAVALSVLVTLFLKIKFRTLLITLGSLAAIFFTFQTEIVMTMERISTDSEGGFENNVVSVVNISTDASNLERLNRWSCALRMWEDKPVFGWGPGTYMFKYAPYQLSRELTIISTNFGTNGNAHSEYLGPLAEQGVLGMVMVLALLFYVTSMGYRLVYTLEDRDDRIIATGLFLGIMTYFVHGFFNNFLDTDKLALPFWAFLAGLVTLDILYKKKAKKLKVKSSLN
jgi:putative inorganic carbon (HCO3(-)) transporter